MDKTFDWVSDEELEGVIDGVYYKFVTETPEGESSGMIGFYGVGSPGELLAGQGVRWATRIEILAFWDKLCAESYDTIRGFRLTGLIHVPDKLSDGTTEDWSDIEFIS